MNWTHDHRDGVDVLTVTGFLRNEATHRFASAVDWVIVRSHGSVILDLTHLRGWDKEGERAVVDAIDRLLERGAPIMVCGLGEATVSRAIPERLRHVCVVSDLETALRDLAAAV
ncbi:STAS domain-containing protein [Streptomyces mayteni]